MAHNTQIRGFTVRHSQSRGAEEIRWDAEIWTEHGWVCGSCLALDPETTDREVNQKIDQLIAEGVAPGLL